MNRIEQLIEILFDPDASPFERDDAAMDLGMYEDSRATSALEQYAQHPIDEDILDLCGEAIAKSWINRNQFPIKTFLTFTPKAQRIIFSYIKQLAGVPPFLETYNPDRPEV